MEPIDSASASPEGLSTSVGTGPMSLSRLRKFALAAGLLAGLVSWAGGEAALHAFRPPLHETMSKGRSVVMAFRNDRTATDAKNAGLAFVILGAVAGLGMGLAGGLARRSRRSAMRAGLIGIGLGAVAAAATSVVLLPWYRAYAEGHPDEASSDLVFPLLVHAGIWSAVGGVAALAFGLGLGERGRLARIVLGGVAGAAFGAIVYEFLGAIVFPTALTAQFVSMTWETRLLARVTVTTLAAVGVLLALNDAPARAGATKT